MHSTQQTQEAIDPFEVILQVEGMQTSVVLSSALDPNQATIAFHVERQWLLQHRIVGELLLVHHGEEARTLLREPLR